MAKGDIISRLKLESGEFDAKIKRAGQELLNYAEHCRKMGLEMGYANRDAKEFAKALGSMQTVSQTARGKINELSEAFVNAKVMYKNMTGEEKKGEFGRNLSASIDQLKTRLNAAKKDLADVQSELNGSKFGQFGNVIDTIGHKLGLTTNATELLTSKTALMYSGIGAGIAIIGKATQEWAAYNAELAKQDQITTVTTGLKDDDAKRMTDTMRALSDTYNVDFRDAINAANTLMSQFGVSGDEAIRLIKDGMKGMIYGDGGKLLSMIQQYAPAFQSAGVSASQLVAVIHNSEGGIFTDQNMNAIVMGIKNIRLMTNSTSEALAKLGLDGQDMAKKMSNGSMTVFDALKMVASQLKNVDSNSQAAGEVMQQVFGRQGAMAGTNLAKAIEGLNTDLEQTKKQLGDVGDAYDKLQEANERLNVAIRDAFGYDGWEQMATGIKSKLVTALATVIEQLGKIRQWFSDFTPEGQTENIQTTEQKDMSRRLAYVRSGSNKQYWHQQNKEYYDQQVSERKYKVLSLRGDDSITRGLRQKAEADLKAWQNLRDEYNKKANEILTTPPKTTTPRTTTPTNPTNPTTITTNTPQEQAAKQVADAQRVYAETIAKADMELKSGLATDADVKKKTLAAQEQLYSAYGKAYATYADPKYKEAQDKAAAEIIKLGGEVKTSIDTQKRVQEAARELERAQKNLADAQTKLTEAKATGDLKNIYTAQKAVDKAQADVTRLTQVVDVVPGKVEMPDVQKDIEQTVNVVPGKVELPDVPKAVTVPITYTSGNLDAFISNLKEQISQADIGSELHSKLTAQLADATTLGTLMQTAIQNGIDTAQFNPQELWKKVFGDNPGDYILDNTWQKLQDEINAKLKELGIKPIKIDFKTGNIVKDGKEVTKNWQGAASAISSVGSAMSQIEDPAAKVMGTIAQAIATIALTYAESLEGTFTPWDWIAGAAAGLAQMTAVISAIHSSTGYAEGGMIKGNSYSGDNLMAQGPNGQLIGLNAGEIVLNRAQQGVIAGALQGGGQTVHVVGKLSGESIFICAENWAKRTGKGEFVTWR